MRLFNGPVVPIDDLEPFHPSFRKGYDHFYAPTTEWPRLEETSLRLPEKYKVDLERLRQELAPFLKLTHPLDPRLSFPDGYRGLGFTCRPESNDPMYDAVKVLDSRGHHITTARGLHRHVKKINFDHKRHAKEIEFTEIADHTPPYLREYLKIFRSEITKVRLMSLEPGFGVRHHVDIPYYEQIRLQLVIDGGENVEWYVEDKKFQIAADGFPVWYDTGVSHSIRNHGSKPRTVLCIHLLVYKNRNGKLRFSEGTSLYELIAKGEL